MEVKHIIITRFYNHEFPWLKNKLSIFDENVLENGFKLLKKYLIPSLENQTNKKFTHILLINEGHKHLKIFKELSSLKPNYDFIILTNIELETYLSNIKTKFKNVIISRIDNDDAVYNGAVDDTQNHFDTNELIKFYGYKNGIVLSDNDKSMYFTDSIYQGGGTNSQFQSIMFTDFTNYKGSIFYDHSNVYKFFNENHIKINSSTYEINEKIEFAYIWTIHDLSSHILAGQTKPKNIIYIKNEKLRILFGIY